MLLFDLGSCYNMFASSLTPNVSPSPRLNPFYDGQQMPINITHCSLRLRSHSAAILCKKIEFLLFKVLRVAEGYVHAHPSSWSLWFLLAHLFHTCSGVNKQTSTSMQLLIKLEPLIFIKSGRGLSSFYYMQRMKALRKERRKKWIDNHFSKSCLRVFLLHHK